VYTCAKGHDDARPSEGQRSIVLAAAVPESPEISTKTAPPTNPDEARFVMIAPLPEPLAPVTAE